MLLRLIAVTLGAFVGLTAPASAASFYVTGLTDSLSGTCAPADAAGLRSCTTLRAAIAEAGVTPEDDDAIVLGTGTYTLSFATPALDGITLAGTGPRSTTIRSLSGGRALTVPAGAEAAIFRVTVSGGVAGGGNELDGGNIFNQGRLDLLQVRITDGSAVGSGGGIANSGGELTIDQALIDGNSAESGGGIVNTGGTLTLGDSTLTGNGGGALFTSGSANVSLSHVTFGPNLTGSALTIGFPAHPVTVQASIFGAANNCSGVPTDLGFNVAVDSSCALTESTSRWPVDPQLGALVDRGGASDVFAIPPTSPAADLVSPCASPFDQRGYLRTPDFLQPCDAGAYEIGGTPGFEPPPPPPPEPTPVPPQPTPTPTPPPAPQTNRSVRAAEVKGTVLVKLPGSKRFVALDEAVIRNGTEVDARKGTVEITTGANETARVSEGIFKVSQAGGVTTLTLSEKLSCPRKSGRASAAAKKVKTRKLFADGKGRFRTKGQYGAATVRGTAWRTTDTCTTTSVRVTQGSVRFRDLVRKRDTVVRKGKSATARAKR